ncbi:S8 family serine peptidase [Arenibacter sp. GZD96]|uniref:S8 family serine peptidase n=1 Tax=Aurantibrevibacter litoralis TaxID=3106030 RepID=UPI002AFF3C9D|nr:S8 family serine peptidase [Arenibacter sp. GZD-96]MEA1786040.1 S8 family serine peptidase [Arenibacter sp. GZD-96]
MCIPLLVCCIAFSANAQKGGNASKDIVVRACTQDIGNGLIRVTFGYDNPNKKEITLASQDDSFVIVGNGKSKSKGPRSFQPGSVNRAFTLEFNAKESVEWTVLNPSGKVFTITANANSVHCPETESGFIVPVFGQGNGKATTLIGSELTSLANGNAGDTPSDIIFQINASQKVLIEIVPQSGKMQAAINLLTTAFGLQYSNSPLLSDFILNPANIVSTIDVFFPINRLSELNTHPQIINFARPLYKPIQNSGIVTSQGDKAQASDIVRQTFRSVRDDAIVPVNGTGIKIGVISDSYDAQPFTEKSRATVDVENGDLPGAGNPNGFDVPVDVIKDFPFGVASDEGRAMLQIVHDVAPGAQLAFNTGVLSPRDFEMAVRNLDNAGCDIIVDDITFTGEPMFGDGRIAQAIKEYTSKPGKSYFTSAGNFANSGYQNVFRASSAAPTTNFLPTGNIARAHVFGTNANGSQDVLQKIKVVPGVYMLVLQWDEGLASQFNSQGATTDLDIYVVDDQGNLIVGNNRVNLAGDPTEFIVFRVLATGEANILITSANGTPPPGLALRYIAFRADGLEFLEYGGAPTVTGHAMTPQAQTVAAVDYRKADSPEPQAFSSYGGSLANNTVLEIDFAAPDGGNTNVASVGQDIAADDDNFPNFFGTSAAAPHAAAAYALMMSALPSWYPEGLPTSVTVTSNLLSDQISQLFKDASSAAGPSERGGAGFINTANTFRLIAAQTANLTSLRVEDGKNPSAEPFEVTILGEFFPEDPKVLFDGQELEITFKSNTEIRALVGVFTGNPALVVQTSAITPGGTDGGNSNELFFFEGEKIALAIRANDTTVEFGQDVSFTYTVQGLPDDVTFESLGLPEIEFSSPAVFPFPDVNNYTIVPRFSKELTPAQQEAFQVNFNNGLLSVTKKDVLIRPLDATVDYGESVEVDLTYTYNTTGISDNIAFLNAIKNAHNSDFYFENTLIFINKLRAAINQQEILNALKTGSWMTSERTIQNKLRAAINGMNLIDLEPENFEDFFNAEVDPITNKIRAAINKLRAVVNARDLLDNRIDLVIENKLRAAINSSGLGDENDTNDYSSVFAVIDAEDASTDTEERTIDKLQAMNLITGLEVTGTLEDRHFIFPGAFLAAMASNFNTTYNSGRLAVTPAVLTASTGDLLIAQGDAIDTSLIATSISGFVFNETALDVFPEGIPYFFVDSNEKEYTAGDTGVFFIKIREPQNYRITYSQMGKLFVNPSGDGLRKIKTFLDCVEYDPNASDGLFYTANFRYENPNAQPIFVLQGPDNFIDANGRYEGELPVVFLPGQEKFKIRFDGNAMQWNLTTFESNRKSATSSSASATSGRCNSVLLDDNGLVSGYVLYPNPVEDILYIELNVIDAITVDVFDMYGVLYSRNTYNLKTPQTIQIEMSSYRPGLYLVRITGKSDVNVFTLVKA